MELQYADLGEAVYKDSYSGTNYSESYKLTSQTAGLGINAVGVLPLGNFSLTAKAGLHQLKNKVTEKWEETVNMGSLRLHDAGKESKTFKKISPSFGIGASYNVVAGLDIGLDYERFFNVADKKWDDSPKFKHDIDVVSLSVRYGF